MAPKKTAPAKAPPPAPEGIAEYPIAAFSVEGNLAYPTQAILNVAGLRASDTANKDRFEQGREKLLATGAFDSVGYRYFTASDGRSYDAVWQILESNPLYPIRYEDLPATPAEIETALKARDPLYLGKIPPVKARLDLYSRLIQDILQKKGFTGTVASKVDAEGPDKLIVVFRPAGNLPSIAEVKFTGNEVLLQTALRPAINGVAVGTRFNEARFRQLLDTSVRPLYEARGRLQVKFPKIVTIPAVDVNGLVVTVTVEEGPVYQLGDVAIAGAGPAETELVRAANFKPGDVANMKAIGEGLDRMRQTLKSQGYMKADATLERKLDDAKKVLNLVVNVDSGPQYTFGKLLVQGLDIESEPVIRKMWTLKEGKPFNPEYPGRFLESVRERGMFDNLGRTRSDVKVNDAAGTVDVTLVFGAAAQTKTILKTDRP